MRASQPAAKRHVFAELEDAEPVTAEDLIREARATRDALATRCDPERERRPDGKQEPR